MSQRTRLIVMVGAALIAWFAFVTLRWAIQPLDDTMTVGKNAKGELVYRHVECGSLFDSSPLGGKPLPELVTPADVEKAKTSLPWAFPRTPCDLVHGQARIVFGIDVATFVLGIAALTAITLRTRQPAVPHLAAA